MTYSIIICSQILLCLQLCTDKVLWPAYRSLMFCKLSQVGYDTAIGVGEKKWFVNL